VRSTGGNRLVSATPRARQGIANQVGAKCSLTTEVGHKEVSSGAQFRGVLRDLTKLEMRHSAVDTDIAHAIEKFTALAIAAPGAEQFSDPLTLFPLSEAATLIVEHLLNQRGMRWELFRTEVGKGQITNQASSGRVLGELCYRKCEMLITNDLCLSVGVFEPVPLTNPLTAV
jgi:hypothetical protein